MEEWQKALELANLEPWDKVTMNDFIKIESYIDNRVKLDSSGFEPKNRDHHHYGIQISKVGDKNVMTWTEIHKLRGREVDNLGTGFHYKIFVTENVLGYSKIVK